MSSLAPLQTLTYILPPTPPASLGTPGRFAWLKLSQLRIDITYQRDILDSGKSNIRRIIEQFDWKKFGMSLEQVTDHVFRQMIGDRWCVQCGMPDVAHRFFSEEKLKQYQEAQRAPKQPK